MFKNDRNQRKTIYKYMPQEVKNPKKVEAGRAGGIATAQNSATLPANKRKGLGRTTSHALIS